MVVCIALGVDCFLRGSLPALIYPGDRIIWKVLAEYSWSPTTTQLNSFLYTATSSTPIRVVTRELRYIHELSLTLEHSMPISSPAALGLTSPRALRSRVLQASSTWTASLSTSSSQNTLPIASGSSFRYDSSPPSTSGCFEAVMCSSPEILIIYGARSTRAPYGVAPEP